MVLKNKCSKLPWRNGASMIPGKPISFLGCMPRILSAPLSRVFNTWIAYSSPIMINVIGKLSRLEMTSWFNWFSHSFIFELSCGGIFCYAKEPTLQEIFTTLCWDGFKAHTKIPPIYIIVSASACTAVIAIV